jgi:hypothetical protein
MLDTRYWILDAGYWIVDIMNEAYLKYKIGDLVKYPASSI